MKKVLFWDFYGTLSIPDKLWSVNICRAALDVFPDCGITFERVVAYLDNGGFPWNHPERDYLDITEPNEWWKYVEKLFYSTYIRCGLTRSEALQAVPMVRRRIIDIKNYRLYEDAEFVLKALSQKGYSHIMLSNNFPELEDICNKLGIGKYFEDYIVSALVGYNKPRKEIFDIAIEKAGFPETCFIIGDSVSADIDGAKNAGIKAILVNSSTECNADYCCNSLTELLNIL